LYRKERNPLCEKKGRLGMAGGIKKECLNKERVKIEKNFVSQDSKEGKARTTKTKKKRAENARIVPSGRSHIRGGKTGTVHWVRNGGKTGKRGGKGSVATGSLLFDKKKSTVRSKKFHSENKQTTAL